MSTAHHVQNLVVPHHHPLQKVSSQVAALAPLLQNHVQALAVLRAANAAKVVFHAVTAIHHLLAPLPVLVAQVAAYRPAIYPHVVHVVAWKEVAPYLAAAHLAAHQVVAQLAAVVVVATFLTAAPVLHLTPPQNISAVHFIHPVQV